MNEKSEIEFKVATPSSRVSTDRICTIIGALFAIAMFVASNVMWNRQSFQKHFSSYYGVNNGGLCNQTSLFIADSNDMNNYQCVSNCPSGYFDQQKLCLPTSNQQFSKYISNPEIAVMATGKIFKWVLIYTAIISLSLGVLRLVFVNCLPRESARIDFFATIVLLIAIGILLLVLYDMYWWEVKGLKIIIAIVCFILSLIVATMICMYGNETRTKGIFLQYAVQFLNSHLSTYAYIPVFLCFSVGLVALFIWQHCCFSSSSSGRSRNFYNFNNAGIWGVLNIIEFIWGIQFLRDSFNFCVSGNVTDHYWRTNREGESCYNSYKRLLFSHWGSVVGGSFLNAFFQLPTFIFNLFRCHPDTCCEKAGNKCLKYNPLGHLIDLIRTDVYACINITSLPYCEAANQCRHICTNSNLFVGGQSPMRNYRFTTHILCITAVFLMAWFIQRDQMQYYDLWNFALLIVMPLLILTWFISIYSDAAEALQTCFLFERQTQSNYQLMQYLSPSFKDDLEHRQKRIKKDGNF